MKTEESIRILLSLYVGIEQNYQALVFYERYLSENALKKSSIPIRKDNSVDRAIIESLWFQIILKSCSFLEEWDNFLAVKTNVEDKDKLLTIKKIVAPARKQIGKWKDLKKFRNEIIAHNLRKSNKEFSLDDIHNYNTPNYEYELFYLVTFLERMSQTLLKCYKKEANNILVKAKKAAVNGKPTYNIIKKNDLQIALDQTDLNIKSNILLQNE